MIPCWQGWLFIIIIIFSNLCLKEAACVWVLDTAQLLEVFTDFNLFGLHLNTATMNHAKKVNTSGFGLNREHYCMYLRA